MIINKITLTFIFFLKVSFAATIENMLPPTDVDAVKIQRFNSKLTAAAFWDSPSRLNELLNNSKNKPKITEKGIGSALIEAVWNESTDALSVDALSVDALSVLLKHPLCSLDYISTGYSITINYFHGPSVTKNMLKIRFEELGGKSSDCSDDDSDINL